MKVTTEMIRKMVLENFNGKVETNIKDNIKMIKEKALVRCFGLMDQSTEDFGRKVFKTVLE